MPRYRIRSFSGIRTQNFFTNMKVIIYRMCNVYDFQNINISICTLHDSSYIFQEMTLGVQPSSLYQFLNYHDPLICLTLRCISPTTTSCQRISLQGISSSTAPFLQIESAIVFNLRNYFLTSKYFRRCDVPLPLPCCHTLYDPGNILSTLTC